MSAQPRLRVRPSAALLAHPLWSETDFAYLRGRGYSNQEVLKFWNRDIKSGGKAVHWHPDDPKYLSALRHVIRR
jgi:hypothetical protein